MAGRSVRGATTTVETWDPAGGTGSVGGGGTWDTQTGNWDINGNAGYAWTNGNDAIFAGTTAGTVTVAPGGVSVEVATFNTSGYVLTGDPITLVNNGVNPEFHSALTTTTTINSVLQGTAGVILLGSSASSSNFTLGGANTYTGTTVIEQANINISTLSSTVGAFGAGGNITLGGLSSAASITNTGAGGTTTALLNFASTGALSVVNNSSTGAISFTNTGVANIGSNIAQTITLKGSYAGVNTFGESLVDLGTGTNVTKLSVNNSSSDTWDLTGSSSFTGGTTLNTGTLEVGQSASLGTGPVVASATASSNIYATTGLTLANAITATSGFTTSLKNMGLVANGTFQVSGLISGAGSVTVGTGSNGSDGPIELSNDSNSFTGTLTSSYGFVEFTSVANAGATSALGAGSNAYVLANATSYGTFQYRGTNNDSTTRAINWTGTTGNLALDSSGTGTVQYLATTALRSGVGVDTLVLQGTNTGLNTLAQVINDSTGGATSVNKAGAGKWVLTATNTYTGTTNVSAGTLVANNATNSLGVGSTTLVYGTGVLAGNGNTGSGAVVIASGGTITAGSGASPSDTIGTLTTGVQTWNASGSYVAKVSGDGTSNDTLVMGGVNLVSSSATSPFNVSLTSQGTTTALTGTQQLVLAIIPNAPAGTFNVASLNLIPTNVTGVNRFFDQVGSYDGFTGDELVVAAPEPTSLLLAAVAGAPLFVGRRRRQ
jgi:fibronectin-binding autotransporter adhesin